MTTAEIYKLAVKIGLSADNKEKSELDILRRQDVAYPDSLILYAKKQKQIKKIAAGIDIDCFHIYFAKKILNCDLVINHHPFSRAANQMPEAVLQQRANLSFYGLAENQIKRLIEEAAEKLRRQVAADNFFKEEQMARQVDIDLMTLHTVADNAAVFILKKMISDKNCSTLGDFIRALSQLKEYESASRLGQFPFIAKGSEKDLLGKVCFSEFVGGQESNPEIFPEMKKAGIETIIVPYLSEDFFAAAAETGLRIIYCGHLASDSLGMNYFLDKLKKLKKDIKILPLGGLLRQKE